MDFIGYTTSAALDITSKPDRSAIHIPSWFLPEILKRQEPRVEIRRLKSPARDFIMGIPPKGQDKVMKFCPFWTPAPAQARMRIEGMVFQFLETLTELLRSPYMRSKS